MPTRPLQAAVRFLLARQDADGAWRSDTYGAFKDGGSLTPLVLDALLTSGSEEALPAVRRGAAYLASMVRSDGTINAGPAGLSYAAYTAPLTALVLSRPEFVEHRAAWVVWLAFLEERQLTEALGWSRDDPEYGGWGYCPLLPRRPVPGRPGPPYAESNVSATALSTEALRAAGVAPSHPRLGMALRFLCRCQNHGDDPGIDDGGFHMQPGDDLRNKAGVACADHTGRVRYRSYGSMTADGLRGLLACGLSAESPRVRVALGWLESNFSAAVTPGRFAPGREVLRDSVYYYYCNSLARALTAAGAGGPVGWRDALAGELVRRQRPDGSWVNDAVEVREDDPVVATAHAVAALALCA
jgi:hypothetical protein